MVMKTLQWSIILSVRFFKKWSKTLSILKFGSVVCWDNKYDAVLTSCLKRDEIAENCDYNTDP
jgi:hypothetical protein